MGFIQKNKWLFYFFIGFNKLFLLVIIIKIEIETLFDSYLYVVNIIYNDKILINNRNAIITKKLDANVPYLIIYTKYNPSTEFTDFDKGDDLVLKIRKS